MLRSGGSLVYYSKAWQRLECITASLFSFPPLHVLNYHGAVKVIYVS